MNKLNHVAIIMDGNGRWGLKQKRYKNQIVDKSRIKQILTLIKKKSISRKIDPKLTKRIWKNIIRAYIDFEKKNFKKK